MCFGIFWQLSNYFYTLFRVYRCCNKHTSENIFRVYRLVSFWRVHNKWPSEEKNMLIVPNISDNTNKDKILQKRGTCFNGYIHWTISQEDLHYRSKKTDIYSTTCMNLGYPLLWKRTTFGIPAQGVLSIYKILPWIYRDISIKI